jgi:hypothetical protein
MQVQSILNTKSKICSAYQSKNLKYEIKENLKGTAFLPPVYDDTSKNTGRIRAISAGSIHKQKPISDHIETAMAQEDRMRVTLREKEIEIGRLKSENAILRQVNID